MTSAEPIAQREKKGKPTVAYVVTCDARMHYPDMALISALSVRESDPGACIQAVFDRESARTLRKVAHPLLEVCDHAVDVETPQGAEIFRNRWLKTQLPEWISGDVLYLDADTFVRRPVLPVFACVSGFGAVANHNGTTLEEQVWSEDRRNEIEMQWDAKYHTYVNGGVWCYRDSELVRRLFALWHDGWKKSVLTTGRLRDQPSLNRALYESGADITVLPGAYNVQAGFIWQGMPDAVVWHFYENSVHLNNAFARLTAMARTADPGKLRRMVARVAKLSAPWSNPDMLASLLDRIQAGGGAGAVYAREWLQGQRRHMLRHLLRGR